MNDPRRDGENAENPANEEDRGLLSGNSSDEEEDIVVHPGQPSPPEPEPRTPRTPNRVRFDLPPVDASPAENGAPPPYNDSPLSGRREPHQQFVPLLTDIEAPSVSLANSPWGDEDVHEWAERERTRPKSGLRSAFMNMANSIIGAGIIGQPYAFRQAGLLTGIILLIGLTITVNWTIRLIVINSKLSGSNSFQGTVEHCFGKTGLIAISVAQWAFAFGGMVAFGIIVGDTIPHVLAAIFPDLRDIPVLSLLVNRRAVIVIFILGISYPLSLYRDIAKVWFPDSNGQWELTGVVGSSKHSCLDQHDDHFIHGRYSRIHGPKRISRGIYYSCPYSQQWDLSGHWCDIFWSVVSNPVFEFQLISPSICLPS
jgi:solute carrier family 38 (sodium-coupled neutral amino acid transporter), member 11